MIYRQSRNYENLNKSIFDGVGKYDTPRLLPTYTRADSKSFKGFNYAKTCKEPENKGLHFFIDDYQFLRLWTNPDAYLGLLRKFKCVCTPDFSTYTDFPKAIQIYNHYRKHWLGAYWQANGINIIPTISWSDESSFDWCFDGEPTSGLVAVSSVGTQMSEETRKAFMLGYNEMLTRLNPSGIIFYGFVPKGCTGNIIPLATFQDGLKQRMKAREASNGR